MSATIYLVRHGRTALNAQDRFRGRMDPPLDQRGREEANRVAERLGSAVLAAVYTSPLLRARQTAAPIAERAGLAVEELPGLTDLDFGEWTGLTREEAALRHPEAFARFRRSPRDAAAPGGETLAEVEDRAIRALRTVAERHPGGAAAAVSHEIPIRLVMARLAGVENPGFWELELPTGSIITLVSRDGGLALGAAPATV